MGFTHHQMPRWLIFFFILFACVYMCLSFRQCYGCPELVKLNCNCVYDWPSLWWALGYHVSCIMVQFHVCMHAWVENALFWGPLGGDHMLSYIPQDCVQFLGVLNGFVVLCHPIINTRTHFSFFLPHKLHSCTTSSSTLVHTTVRRGHTGAPTRAALLHSQQKWALPCMLFPLFIIFLPYSFFRSLVPLLCCFFYLHLFTCTTVAQTQFMVI